MDAERLIRVQQAIDTANDDEFIRLVEPSSGAELSEIQMYAESSLLMYVRQRGTPAMVKALLDKEVEPLELPFSDNNELKAAARNSDHGATMVEMVLDWLEPQLARDMITQDWGFEDDDGAQTALEIASEHTDPRCAELMQARLT